MRTLSKCFALALLCAFGASAQYWDRFTTSYSVTLAGATTAFAVQLPSTGTHQTEILETGVQCTADCPLRFEVNSAAASALNATAGTVVALNPESTPASLVTTPNIQAWYGTGVPTGTTVLPTMTYPANAIVPFGSGRILSTKSATNVNYIIRVPTNYTGTITIYFSLRVRR